VTLILDAGAFIALERGDRALLRRLNADLRIGDTPRTNGGVVAQIWRGGRDRQVRLVRALRAVSIESIDGDLGRRAGLLLGATKQSDPIDATVVAMARSGDLIATSDVRDIERLISASGRDIATLPV
jgi:predicted nucleic acid-binding protein